MPSITGINVKLPDLGESIHEVFDLRYNKNVGDTVKEGEVIGEVDSDKVTVEITSPCNGILKQWLFEQGSDLSVLLPVAVIEEQKITDEDISKELQDDMNKTFENLQGTSIPIYKGIPLNTHADINQVVDEFALPKDEEVGIPRKSEDGKWYQNIENMSDEDLESFLKENRENRNEYSDMISELLTEKLRRSLKKPPEEKTLQEAEYLFGCLMDVVMELGLVNHCGTKTISPTDYQAYMHVFVPNMEQSIQISKGDDIEPKDYKQIIEVTMDSKEKILRMRLRLDQDGYWIVEHYKEFKDLLMLYVMSGFYTPEKVNEK